MDCVGNCVHIHSLCSCMFIMFINYIEMVRTDVEKLVNDKVIHGIQK